MNITEIKIRKLYNEGRLRALVSIIIDSDFAVHDIKVIEGPSRVFVAMPSRKEPNGTFRDVTHPITAESRKQLEEAVLEEYKSFIETHATLSEEDTRDNNNSYSDFSDNEMM